MGKRPILRGGPRGGNITSFVTFVERGRRWVEGSQRVAYIYEGEGAIHEARRDLSFKEVACNRFYLLVMGGNNGREGRYK